MKWIEVNDHHWRLDGGPYFVSRRLTFENSAEGEELHLGWYKPSADAVAECVSAMGRKSREGASRDCAAHMRSKAKQQQSAASITEGE